MQMRVDVPPAVNWTAWFIGILLVGFVGLGFLASYERQQFKIEQLNHQVEKAQSEKAKAERDLIQAQSHNESLQNELETLKKIQVSTREVEAQHTTRVATVVQKAKVALKKLPKPLAKAQQLPPDPVYEQHSAQRIEALWSAYCAQPTDASLCPTEQVAS